MQWPQAGLQVTSACGIYFILPCPPLPFPPFSSVQLISSAQLSSARGPGKRDESSPRVPNLRDLRSQCYLVHGRELPDLGRGARNSTTP